MMDAENAKTLYQWKNVPTLELSPEEYPISLQSQQLFYKLSSNVLNVGLLELRSLSF